MSIELNRRVKQLELQLAEVNRLIAEIKASEPSAVEMPEERRRPGRPSKNGQGSPTRQSD